MNDTIYSKGLGESTVRCDAGIGLAEVSNFISRQAIFGTGNYTLNIQDEFQNSSFFTFSFIAYGDVNGDGEFTVSDLVAVKKHLLKTELLNGIFLKAGDVFRKGNISISDLLSIKKHILLYY